VVSSITVQPWEYPVPPYLYKYLRPERIDVLATGHVRFSQRSVFDDDHELQPDYGAYGTEQEINRFLAKHVSAENRRMLPSGIARFVANSASWQNVLKNIARLSMKSPDHFGIFCLTESATSEQMWSEYAGDSRGFVICFDTAHPGFEQLKEPGRIGKVSYSDVPFGTYLGAMEEEGAGIFCRKRTKYAFEGEWRCIRALGQLEQRAPGLFLSPFDPASVAQLFIRANCQVEAELRQFVREDVRYKHVRITI
jgi:hypothetical protein